MKFKNPIRVLLLVFVLITIVIGSLYIFGVIGAKDNEPLANKNFEQETQKEKTQDIVEPITANDIPTGSIDTNDMKKQDSDEEKAEDLEETVPEEEWVVQNKVNIIDNSPEYEAEMWLCYDKENKAFIELEYYYEGLSQSRRYSSSHIPFLKEIENEGALIQVNSKALQEAVLNSKLAKLYFFTRKKTNAADEVFYLYVLNLKDGNIKEIYIGEGTELSKLYFSTDKKLAAFNYSSSKDLPIAESMLQILDCSVDKWLVVEGKTAEGIRIGQEGASSKYYTYQILSWKSANEILLKEISYDKAAQNNDGISSEIEVIYDTSVNLIKYPKGYDSQGNKIQTEEAENADKPEDSPAVSTLKNFYILINKAEYDKAYDLLDDRFRLNAFKVFGAIEISKSEIDVELFSEFAETTGIFKSLSIKEIIKEEAEDNSSKIYYHQSVRLEEAKDPVEMPLVATLKKVDSEWKIVALDDWETS